MRFMARSYRTVAQSRMGPAASDEQTTARALRFDFDDNVPVFQMDTRCMDRTVKRRSSHYWPGRHHYFIAAAAPGLCRTVSAACQSPMFLNRRARNVAIGAEDAAIPRLRFQDDATMRAIVKELAGIGRHGFQ
ncbi:hypothetical protein AD933_05385 [Acetobacter malorum]|uniref:Uncharacterized protein n=1 Tax=Acetobacter malorum TaxID=178901 RepID=A0A149RR34_9PROT|nr:hypothetical protein AD933_05385 [Acetobacter malorum]